LKTALSRTPPGVQELKLEKATKPALSLMGPLHGIPKLKVKGSESPRIDKVHQEGYASNSFY